MKGLLIFLLVLWSNKIKFVKNHKEIDISNINYCKLNCSSFKSSACNCTIVGNHKEDVSDLLEFRKEILSKFNSVRSRISKGEGSNHSMGSAELMYPLNYDIELEYVARCYGLKYIFYHDKCRRTSKFLEPGQIIMNFETKQSRTEILDFVEIIYQQISLLTTETIESYNQYIENPKKISDLTEIIWWSQTNVGCARIENPDAFFRTHAYLVICNFGGLSKSNVYGAPVYREGDTCSMCPVDIGCNVDSLCGEVKQVENITLVPITKEISTSIALYWSYDWILTLILISLHFY